MERYDRNIRLFGAAGQQRLAKSSITICGLGGIGSIVNQQCALLGVGGIAHVDHDFFSSTSRNRLVGFNSMDPIAGVRKTELARRVVASINPDVTVNSVSDHLESPDGIAAVLNADWVFGCLDHDGPRFILNEVCMAYRKNYVDLATDVPEDGVYGGRVYVSWSGRSCLYCKQLLDLDDVRRYLTKAEDRAIQDDIYGVSKNYLNETGPSVVSLNGVIASIGVTEFMLAVTGMRQPVQLQTYRADIARITKDDSPRKIECPYCIGMWGVGDRADIHRYINSAELA